MPPNPKKTDFTILALATTAILFSVWYLSTHPLPKLVEEVKAEEATHSEITMYAVKDILEGVTVTAYTSRPEETDNTPCLAASGRDICELHAKGIATCAANGPGFGTWIFVEGYGRCRVEDRLAAKYSRRVDLYFGGADQVQKALRFGKKRLQVFVLE